MQRRWGDVLAVICAAIVALACLAVIAVRISGMETGTGPGPQLTAGAQERPPTPTPYNDTRPVGAVMIRSKVSVRTKPDLRSPVLSTIGAGILLPVITRQGSFVHVLTPCQRTGWIAMTGQDFFQKSKAPATKLEDATIVIDPGHGGSESGATGPTGLKESTVNLDIARRLARRLPGRVFITRSGEYVAGLAFRVAIANTLHADAFLSVHNNAQPDGPSAKPGTETYYQARSASSKRLAGLTYEELFKALRPLGVKWVSDKDAGAKYRTNAAGLDFYGVLRRSKPPAVITESLFISNRPEEALLRQGAVRDRIAGALSRAVRRYVTTRDPGSGFVKPLLKNEGSTFVLPSKCVDPS